MSAQRAQLAARFDRGLDEYEAAAGRLPGFSTARRTSLVGQLVDSSRRTAYVHHLRTEPELSRRATDPSEIDNFDPLRAAIIHHRDGNDDEAFWMMFLFTHFGKNRRAGWRYAREVYGALGAQRWWTWERVVRKTAEFRDWLDIHRPQLSDPSRPRGFGNHRKYESLAGWTPAGTGTVVASYVAWVGDPARQRRRFDEALARASADPKVAFDLLYRSMNSVARFGRTARFDYLSMIGKSGLAAIEPGKTYMQGATGPLKGARLLFEERSGESLSIAALEDHAGQLAQHLDVTFDVLEDALCNWQKSPATFKPFRG